MILSVIIPVYNEEKTILQILEKIKKNPSNVFKHEIIVIDDGSTDQSRKLLEGNENLYDKLLINDTNKGKGYSVKKGILNLKRIGAAISKLFLYPSSKVIIIPSFGRFKIRSVHLYKLIFLFL